MDIKNLSLDELTKLAAEKKTAYDAIMAADDPSNEELAQAETLGDERDEIDAAIEAAKKSTPEAKAARKEALASRKFAGDEPEETEEERKAREAREAEAAANAENPDAENQSADEGAESTDGGGTEAAKRPPVKTEPVASVKDVAARALRPTRPATNSDRHMSIVASANVNKFQAGSTLDGLDELGEAVVDVMSGFTAPNGDGKSVDLRKFGVAKLQRPFDEDVITRPNDPASALAAVEAAINKVDTAADSNDPDSLVAAGWCSPSETLYDLPSDESTDGMLSLPEMQVSRGGIRFTLGPQFADFYAEAGFIQTEAQAIANTVKPCYEVDCPSFTDVRMDAVGICIKVPILTNAAFPELVQRHLSGSLIAHQHMVNANVIGRIVTSAGAARVFAVDTTTSMGATTTDSLAALELAAEQRRQTYRLSFNKVMEVVLPHWTLGMFRADMSRRAGISPADPVTDAMILALFRNAKLNVQFVYDWQDLTLTDEVYPATFNALIYPAGTFVKGTSDVVNLSAVYDAASLAVNTYTGLFMEEGLLVARRQYAADLLTIPVCNAGRTGAADITCAAA